VAAELKTVVAELHRAGLEVLMALEFCVTGEGADAATGGLQGMRGLDAQIYYRQAVSL
jgi:pullulanase/glycogen debranching enzyme